MPLTNSSKMLKQVRKLYKHKHKKNKNDTETSVDNNNDNNNNPTINANASRFYDNNCNIVSNSCENVYTEFSRTDNVVSSSSIRESQRLQTEIQTESTTSSQSRTTIETTELLQKNLTETPTDTKKASKPRKLSLPDKVIRFDEITPTENPKSNSTQNPKANKDTFSLRIHLFKKRKGNSRGNNINKLRRKGSAPDGEKTKSSSGTIPEFTSRRHSAPMCVPATTSKRLNDNFETSSRTSINSLEALRENRRSVISKLDDYIKHVRKSIDEGNIASAPNRLCCAQLLRTVYLQREQQHRYESLRQQQARRQGKHHSLPDVLLSSKSASQSNSRSLQNFHDTSFDSSSSDSPRLRAKFPYETPEDSDCSSISSSEYNTHARKDFDSFTTVGSNLNSINNNFIADNGCSTEDDGDSTDNDYEKFYQKRHSKNSHRILPKNERRKSMPLFPQALDIDIY